MLEVLCCFSTGILIATLQTTNELLQHRRCTRHDGSGGAATCRAAWGGHKKYYIALHKVYTQAKS